MGQVLVILLSYKKRPHTARECSINKKKKIEKKILKLVLFMPSGQKNTGDYILFDEQWKRYEPKKKTIFADTTLFFHQ